MPLSYSSGQAISMGAIRDHHGGSGSVSMRDFAIGGSLIYKATSVAGSTEQGYNNFATQAQLDAGTHTLSLDDLRTTYKRTTCATTSMDDVGSSSLSPRTWQGPSGSNYYGGWARDFGTGHSQGANVLAYAKTWNGVGICQIQVNTSGFYYIKGYGGGDGQYNHKLTVTGDGLASTDVSVVWANSTNANSYSSEQRIELTADTTFEVRVQLNNIQYTEWQMTSFYLYPNGDTETWKANSKSDAYNHIWV
jgi:hypothetical protein